MSTSAHKRLTSEYRKLIEEPVDLIQAKPQEDNILIWHFILEGPPNTSYSGGQYYGEMVFLATYPMDAPSLKMITPNGRFVPGKAICVTMTNYHKSDWDPTWSVSSMLVALLTFMLDESRFSVGSIKRSASERIQFAESSREFNNQCENFIKQFPDVVELNKEKMNIVEGIVSPSVQVEKTTTGEVKKQVDAPTTDEVEITTTAGVFEKQAEAPTVDYIEKLIEESEKLMESSKKRLESSKKQLESSKKQVSAFTSTPEKQVKTASATSTITTATPKQKNQNYSTHNWASSTSPKQSKWTSSTTSSSYSSSYSYNYSPKPKPVKAPPKPKPVKYVDDKSSKGERFKSFLSKMAN